MNHLHLLLVFGLCVFVISGIGTTLTVIENVTGIYTHLHTTQLDDLVSNIMKPISPWYSQATGSSPLTPPGTSYYLEDFTTTTYRDLSNTNVTGWGDGTIRLPNNAPTIAGTCNTPSSAVGVFVAGNYAYVADHVSGLQVINITDPTAPSIAGTCNTPDSARGVFVAGNYAYVADWGSGLQVLNITDPTNPFIAGVCDTPSYSRGVFVDGDYAYVADDTSGLQVVNIADPTAPSIVGTCDTPVAAYGVFVVGDYAYVADHSSGLQVVNIADPTAPSIVGTCDTPSYAYGLFVLGDYAYVADGFSGLQIINIADPTDPFIAGAYNLYWSLGVFADGDYAYVADADPGLQVLNITDPTDPFIAGVCDTPSFASDVFVVGDYAYVADDTSGLQVVKITNLTELAPLAVAQSFPVFDNSAMLLVRATLTSSSTVPSGTAVTYYLSADDGVHWEQVTPASEHTFAYTGHQLKWKAVLTTSDSMKTPTVSSLSITYHTVMGAPSLLSPGNGTATADNTPMFTWGALSGAASYLIQLDTVVSFNSLDLINATSGAPSYTPATALSDGVWYWRVVANDSDGELGIFSGTWSFTIETSAPTWDQTPTNQVVEFYEPFWYDLNASDPSGIDTWWLNDTVHFTMDSNTGIITNVITLPVDTYGLRVWVNDTLNNIQTTTFTVTVQDTTPPTWDQTPTNQTLELGDPFRYDLNASDPSGIDTWWLNDTVHFTMDSNTGIITNATALPMGIYGVQVWVNDSYTNIRTRTFTVTVQDTILPTWDQLPTNQQVMLGAAFTYDVNASDLGGIAYYWVNDTSHFVIDGNGVITNATALTVGVYGVEVRAYDPASLFCTATISVTVQDITPPAWDETPTDHVVELGASFRYDLNASDASGIDLYWINDTTHFVIDRNGIITNHVALVVGVYRLEVRAYDPTPLYCAATFIVTVQDTTAPTWDQVPADQVVALGTPFHFDLYASDPAGIDHWWLNDTTHFIIDAAGTITNATTLQVGTYGLEVRAFDPSNHYCSAAFTVTVEAPTSTPPPIPGYLVLAMVLGLVGAIGTAMYVLYRRRQLGSKPSSS